MTPTTTPSPTDAQPTLTTHRPRPGTRHPRYLSHYPPVRAFVRNERERPEPLAVIFQYQTNVDRLIRSHGPSLQSHPISPTTSGASPAIWMAWKASHHAIRTNRAVSERSRGARPFRSFLKSVDDTKTDGSDCGIVEQFAMWDPAPFECLQDSSDQDHAVKVRGGGV
jgi:hypothetical protein